MTHITDHKSKILEESKVRGIESDNFLSCKKNETGGDGGVGCGMVLFFMFFSCKLHTKITLDAVLLDMYIK